MLSCVVLSKNEEKTIEKCLKSISFSNEIIVVDDYSSDSTVDIVKKYTKKIFKHRLNNNFSKQRNIGLEKAQNEWVMFIDSDEIVSKKLQQEVLYVIKNTSFDGFYIPRRDIFYGKQLRYGEFKKFSLLRLAKRNKGKWFRPIHETWDIRGRIGYLKSPIMHYSHSNASDLLVKFNYYTSINSQYLYVKRTTITIFGLFLYPSIKFIHNYDFKLGFLDGIEGLIFSIFMSLHSFLTRAKLYILNNHQ